MANTKNIVEIIAEKDARIAELESLVKYYEELFKLSKMRRYAPSSEKACSNVQLSLFADDSDVTGFCPDGIAPETEKVEYIRRKKRVGKRKEDLSGLPVEVVEHKLSEEDAICPECGSAMHEMGRDVRREIEIIPAQVKVVEHRRAIYSCRNCEIENDHVPIVKAQFPVPLIKGSLASASLVAYIMVMKYVMCAPLYRQQKEWEMRGVSISRQTMANWIIRCAFEILALLYEKMRGVLLEHDILHADETTVQVLKEPGKSPTSKSYMWLYRTSGDATRPVVIFEYQPSRESSHPRQFLSGFNGLLHADGYAGYHALNGMTIVGCWVHLRRKFTDSVKILSVEERADSVAQEALRQIGWLFHLEKQWLNLPSDERHKLRLEKSKPLALAFFNWCERQNVLPKSATGRAIHYALEQKQWLMNVYLDGRTEISNNRIENSVRPFAVGRRNWLFCDTINGAKANAIIYSIIETARANNLKPFEYLKFLLENLPRVADEIDDFMPWGSAVPDDCHMQIENRKCA